MVVRSVLVGVVFSIFGSAFAQAVEPPAPSLVVVPPEPGDETEGDYTLWSEGAYIRLMFGGGRFALKNGEPGGHDVYKRTETGKLLLSGSAGYRFANGLQLGLVVESMFDDILAKDHESGRIAQWRRQRSVRGLAVGFRVMEWEHNDLSIASLTPQVIVGNMSYSVANRGHEYDRTHYGRALGVQLVYDYLYNEYLGFSGSIAHYGGRLNHLDKDSESKLQDVEPPPQVTFGSDDTASLTTLSLGLLINVDTD